MLVVSWRCWLLLAEVVAEVAAVAAPVAAAAAGGGSSSSDSMRTSSDVSTAWSRQGAVPMGGAAQWRAAVSAQVCLRAYWWVRVLHASACTCAR